MLLHDNPVNYIETKFSHNGECSSAVARERLRDLGYSSRDMKGAVDTMASISILQVPHMRGWEPCIHSVSRLSPDKAVCLLFVP